MHSLLLVLLHLFYIHISFQSILEDSKIATSKGLSLKSNDVKLRHIHVLFRHGDRSPMCSHVLSDLPFEKLWPAGRGQLSDYGIVQEFSLGRWMRLKYSGFVPQEYNGSEYYMRSTDIDRTLMSAQSFTEGFYEKGKSPLQEYNIAWRPIPVHTVKSSEDILLSAADCPLLEKLHEKEMNSKQSLDFEQEHRALFNSVTEHMSWSHFDRNSLWEVHDATVCMRAHNMSLWPWLNSDLLKEMDEVARFYWVRKYASTAEIVRLEIGVFLHTMLEHMTAVAAGTSLASTSGHHLSTQHLMAYSAHDTDVTYLLAAFGVYDNKSIEYSASVVFELHGPEPPAPPNEYLFRLRYKRGWRDETGEYLLPKVCEGHDPTKGCPLDVLKRGMQSMQIARKDFKAACSLGSSPLNYLVFGLSALVILLAIGCIGLSVAAYRLYRRRKAFTFKPMNPEI